MHKISVILSLCSLCVFGSVEMARAQAVASGQIVDAQTGKPLVGAHVYLSGTTIGTATSASGQYRLRLIPAGGYRLVVSMIGYKQKVTDIVIGHEENKTMDFEMKPVIYKMPEIFVGDLDEKWEKNLERFAEAFIGESEWADSVKILNPEVLRFDKKWWGRLSAEALAPLQVENRALGYYITYQLDDFNHSGGRTRWDGEPLFTEMVPVDSSQAVRWEQNRKKAFYGSLRHFLLALLGDRVKEEGFILYNIRKRVDGFSSERQLRISAESLIREGEEAYLYQINFLGQLQVIYKNEREHPGYLRWKRDELRGTADNQTSYIELNEHPVTIDSDGEIIQPYGATQFGYFAYSRLADLTPRGYRPEDYGLQNGD